MSVGRICRREVHLADLDESVQTAAKRMRDRRVGTLLVCDPEGLPLGIVSDRDLCARVLADGRDPRRTKVSEVMTRDPVTVRASLPIEDALKQMRSLAVRRLPVVDDQDQLVGVLSLDDVLSLLAEEMREIGELVDRQEPVRI